MSDEEKRGYCTGHGKLTCGACVCDPDFYGKMCECTSKPKADSCKASPNDNKKCNNRGECKCNKCECHEGYTGDFCEHDKKQCPGYEGE